MSSGHLAPVPSPGDRDPDLHGVAYVLFQVKFCLPDHGVVEVGPKTIARDALALMKQHGYSQVPVVHQRAVLGIFSHRSFAEGVLELAGESRLRPEQLSVMDFVEQLNFVDLDTDIAEILANLDVDNAVVVGDAQHLVGLATPMDALRFYYRVASAFLLVQEIERGIRMILREALAGDALADAMGRCKLTSAADSGPAPTELEDLSFGDYLQLIANKENWTYLEPFFGTSRDLVMTKLRPVQRLRNDAFHFRRELTDSDHERLRSVMAWLRLRLRQFDGDGGEA